MTERELTKEELGCAIVALLIFLIISTFIIVKWVSSDYLEQKSTPTAPVVERQATNNEIMKEIKKLQNGY